MSLEVPVLKKATNVQEKVINQLMESLPQTEVASQPQVSGLASEGIGSNLDLKA
jgi:hypothetical protein